MSVWKGGLWRSQFSGGGGAVNEPPTGPITVTAPAEAGSEGTFDVSFAGATDPEGDPITYKISDTGGLTFSKTEGITEGESVGVTAPKVTEDTGVAFTVRAVDNRGAKSAGKTSTVTVVANKAPTGPITVEYTGNKESEDTFQVAFSGATDPESDPITYQVTDTGSLTFSKTAGIAANEQVDVTAPHTENSLDVTYKVAAVDSNDLASSKQSETVTIAPAPPAQIIGVEMTATGGPGGTWNHIDENGDSISDPGKSGFDAHPVWGGMQDVTIDGQKMVKVPKFYYKRGKSTAGNSAWWISDLPAPGFTVMPAFKLNGAEVSEFQYGKYQASESGGKLQSVPDVMPLVDTSTSGFISKAEARNTGGVSGFRLQHYDMCLAIQWLYLVENATMDSQNETGVGHAEDFGTKKVDDPVVAQATYRGIVGLWGNVRQRTDGLRVNDKAIERRGYNDSSWTDTGETGPGSGPFLYPITFRDTGDEQIIADTFTNSNDNSATMPDTRLWYDSGKCYPLVGGAWGDNDGVGLWYLYCRYSASTTNSNIGARVARVVP